MPMLTSQTWPRVPGICTRKSRPLSFIASKKFEYAKQNLAFNSKLCLPPFLKLKLHETKSKIVIMYFNIGKNISS